MIGHHDVLTYLQMFNEMKLFMIKEAVLLHSQNFDFYSNTAIQQYSNTAIPFKSKLWGQYSNTAKTVG